jgi:hypothetical protein
LLNNSNLYSQSNKEESFHNWFDNSVGKENLNINNGPSYRDNYVTIGDNNMYYIANKFMKGNVTYDGQTYYDLNIKYDTYRDQLIINPLGESKYSSIALIQDKISAFTVNGKNFIKLNKEVSPLSQLTTGYYELNVLREGFIFYNNTYYTSNSKSEVLKIFPTLKKQINDFYAMNREIRKSDNDQFMINLLKHINSSLLITEK